MSSWDRVIQRGAATPVFMGAKSCEKSSIFCATFDRELFAFFETFAARPLWGDESFVRGIGRMRRRDPSFCIEQRQEASTPLYTTHHTAKPARATHKSTGNKLVVPHPVLCLQYEQRNASIMPSLAKHVDVSSSDMCIRHGRPVAGNAISSYKCFDSAVHLSWGFRACAWRERVYVRGSA